MTGSLGVGIILLTIFSNSFLAILILKKNYKSVTNIIFSILAISLTFWSVGNYIALLPNSEMTRLFWVRFVMFATTPFGPLIFLLASSFPNTKIYLSKKTWILLLTLTFLSFALSFSPFMFTSLKNNLNGGFDLTPGPAIIIFAINFFVFLFWGFIRLFKKYKKSVGNLKKQYRVFILGIIISFSLMSLTNFVAVVIFRTIQLTFLGPPFTLIMVVFIAYAIVRHGLFDIKVIATQIFTFSLWIILFLKIFTAGSYVEAGVDLMTFIFSVLFGLMLIRSVVKEVAQKEELEKLTKKLKELDDRKNEFISVAAHELRTPLTAIKGYISMLLDGDAGKISPTAADFLQDSAVSTDRMIRLVNNLLNVGRIEEKRIVYQMSHCKLVEVAKPVFNQFMLEAQHKGIEYKLEIAPNLVDDVYIDKDRFPEVMINFISNAIKYTEEGRVVVKLTNPNSKIVKFEVVDSGPGISEEEQKRLFQKFYRAKSTAGKTIGTGLGLYVSKLLVDKFKGNIGVIAKSGKGCNFWFELPIVKNQTNISRQENDKSTS